MFTRIDNFLSARAFAALLEAAETGAFRELSNDVDGVIYPLICADIPDIVRKEVEFLAGKPVNAIFMRRSPEGIEAPHKAHTDNSMGRTSLMLYLQNPPAPDQVLLHGTSFLRHRVLGVAYAPAVQELVDLCHQDTNNDNAWAMHSLCPMQANRACIFDAGYFHRAEPVGGFGEGASARTVLTAFFD